MVIVIVYHITIIYYLICNYNNYGIWFSTYPTHPNPTITIDSTAMTPSTSTASAPTVVPTNPTALICPINQSLVAPTLAVKQQGLLLVYDSPQSANLNVSTTLTISNYFRRS